MLFLFQLTTTEKQLLVSTNISYRKVKEKDFSKILCKWVFYKSWKYTTISKYCVFFIKILLYVCVGKFENTVTLQK